LLPKPKTPLEVFNPKKIKSIYSEKYVGSSASNRTRILISAKG